MYVGIVFGYVVDVFIVVIVSAIVCNICIDNVVVYAVVVCICCVIIVRVYFVNFNVILIIVVKYEQNTTQTMTTQYFAVIMITSNIIATSRTTMTTAQ